MFLYVFDILPYRLDSVGEDEVGINKVSYEGTLNELYDGDRNRFVEYNINDVVIH
jgi:hypothetical protein